MTKILITLLALLTSVAAFAQGPQPKSQEELDALLKIQDATDPNARIAASDEFLKTYGDSDFREFANYMLMLSYQQLNDFDNMMLYGDQTLALNPDNTGALIALAGAIPLRVGEFDIDREEKLAKADDFAKRAVSLIPNMEKPNPAIPDEQWLLSKKELMAQAHEALGITSYLRGDFMASEAALRKTLELSVEQTPMTFYYLSRSLLEQKKYEEADQMADKAVAAGGVPAGGTDLAQDLKTTIAKSKELGTTPSEQKSGGATGMKQVQIKQ